MSFIPHAKLRIVLSLRFLSSQELILENQTGSITLTERWVLGWRRIMVCWRAALFASHYCTSRRKISTPTKDTVFQREYEKGHHLVPTTITFEEGNETILWRNAFLAHPCSLNTPFSRIDDDSKPHNLDQHCFGLSCFPFGEFSDWRHQGITFRTYFRELWQANWSLWVTN